MIEKYTKLKGVYFYQNDIIKFINAKNQENPVFQTCKLISYEDYQQKYNVLHKIIAKYYDDTKDIFDSMYAILNDFIFWCPNLFVKTGEENNYRNDNNHEARITKAEELLKSLQGFKDISSNEEEIINKYTQELGSFYKDFNVWLNTLDPFAYNKISWFIAKLMNALDKYSINKGHGLRERKTLYRGIKMSISDLLFFQMLEGQLVTFPSLTSTSIHKKVAEEFSWRNKSIKQREEKGIFSVILTIDYIFKDDFYPYSIDVSEISDFPSEDERLFPPFSFFFINEVKIGPYDQYYADIKMTSVGRKGILELELKDNCNLVYDKNDGYMKVEKYE